MITYALVLVMLVFAFLHSAVSQTDSSKTSPDTTDLRNSFREEILLENLNTDDEDSELLEYLENLKRNPADLNKVTLQELESIPFIGSVLAGRIISFRSRHGTFSSKRQLLKIEGISDELYERIKVYFIAGKNSRDVTIDETGLRKSGQQMEIFDLNFRSRFFQELQPKKGYLNRKYEGSRAKIYNRIHSKLKSRSYDLLFNLTSEKDPGEKNYSDFISGNISLSNLHFIKKMIAGDYSLNFGQGLTVWNGQSFSKGISAVSTVKKRERGLREYSSVGETQFFRGVALNTRFDKIDFIFFYSRNSIDASVDTVTGFARSLYYDGYHRSSSEILRKNTLQEKLFGARAVFRNNNLKIGLTYRNSEFSKEIARDSSKRLYAFSGKLARGLGVDYDLVIESMNFFGEWSESQSGSIASINGVQFTLYKSAELVFAYRNYPKDFAPFHSSGFGEKNGDTYNEKGFYSGITVRPLKGLILNSYFDIYEFPYRTYLEPLPVAGNDFLFNAEWRAAKGLVLNLKYRNETKEEAGTSADEVNREIKLMHNRNQMNIRTDLVYQVTDRFRLRSRYEYSSVKYNLFGSGSKGALFYSELKCMPLPGLVFETRFTLFNTDNYDSRIYEYENDIKGVMSNVALYGKGRRWYMLLRHRLFKSIELSVKYAETFYDGVKSIGNGNDEITGDVNNKLSFGLDAEF